jgi:hypothetical protein
VGSRPSRVGFDQEISSEAGPHVITYRATLDVPASTVLLVSRWLLIHRKVHDRRHVSRDSSTPRVRSRW